MDERFLLRGYAVDIVICIDATSSMAPFLDQVKKKARSFPELYAERMEEVGKDLEELRVKIVAFRDYEFDEEPMRESSFFSLPEQTSEFVDFLDSIEAKGGGDEAENALEALALALKSDWTTGGRRRRHVILVFTDAPALPLGERAGCPSYPAGMPKNLAELSAWWEGRDPSFSGSYQPLAGRLIAFAPERCPWNEMQVWNRYWPVFSSAGTDASELDFECALDLICGAI